MIFQNKQGDLKIAPALTKTNNPSKRNKKPSLVLESDGKIDEPKIVKKGIKVSAEDLTGQNARRKEAKKIDKKMDLSTDKMIKERRNPKGKYDLHYNNTNSTKIDDSDRPKDHAYQLKQAVYNINDIDKTYLKARSESKQIDAINNIVKLYNYTTLIKRSFRKGIITKDEMNEFLSVLDTIKEIKGHVKLSSNSSHLRHNVQKEALEFVKKKYAHLL
jgi:hypothetical protein